MRKSQRFRPKRSGRTPPASEARTRTQTVPGQPWKDVLERIIAPRARAVRNLVSQLSSAVDRLRLPSPGRRPAAARGRPWVRQLEAPAVQLLQPLVRWLDVASRSEVNRLSRQLDQLERLLRQQQRQRARAKAWRATPRVAELQETAITTPPEEPLPESGLAAAPLPSAAVSEEIPIIATAASD